MVVWLPTVHTVAPGVISALLGVFRGEYNFLLGYNYRTEITTRYFDGVASYMNKLSCQDSNKSRQSMTFVAEKVTQFNTRARRQPNRGEMEFGLFSAGT
jgi:hypothetical protein